MPTAYTKQGERFQITSCHGATSFYIIAKLGFGWLVFFNKLFRNISWSKPKERILIYPIPFISNWIHLFRVSASSTFHSVAMWILLISLQNSQSPLVSLTIIQPPSNEKLLWSSLFASSPKTISIKKKKKKLKIFNKLLPEGICMISSVDFPPLHWVVWEALRAKKIAKVAQSFRNGYAALTWVSNGYASHRKLHRGEEGKCREQISRHIFFLDTIFKSKCGLQIFSDCSRPAACSYPVLYSQRINLDKQDGAFDIYSGRRSENHLPRRLHYLSIISPQNRKLSPHFGMGGKGAAYCSLSTFIECVLFYWFIFQYEFSQQSAKIKTCSEKTHPQSFFFVLLGKSTELQKNWKTLHLCLRRDR